MCVAIHFLFTVLFDNGYALGLKNWLFECKLLNDNFQKVIEKVEVSFRNLVHRAKKRDAGAPL